MNWIEMLVTVVGLLGAAAAGLGWFIKVTVNDQIDRLRSQQRCNYLYLAERTNDVIDRLNLCTEALFQNGRARPIPPILTDRLPHCPSDD